MRNQIEKGVTRHGERAVLMVRNPRAHPADPTLFAQVCDDVYGIRVDDVHVGYAKDGVVHTGADQAPGAYRVLYAEASA